MDNIANDFVRNYDAITKSTKGAAPATQVLWTAIALSIYEAIESLVVKNPVKHL